MNNINICEADLKALKEKYQGENLDIALNKIKNGYPVQYLIGDVNFYGNTIKVNESVLIPRYETEYLVDLIIKRISKNFSGSILDIGTGSGCISISLAKELKNASIIGIDVSNDAINVANENKNVNNVENVNFINKDLFTMDNFDGYNIIVSNPPYVSYDEEVGIETKYEPQNAIFAPDNGLKYYEYIIKKVSLSKDISDLFFEIGMNQYEPIKKYKEEYLKEYNIDVYKDLANKDRYIHIYLNK